MATLDINATLGSGEQSFTVTGTLTVTPAAGGADPAAGTDPGTAGTDPGAVTDPNTPDPGATAPDPNTGATDPGAGAGGGDAGAADTTNPPPDPNAGTTDPGAGDPGAGGGGDAGGAPPFPSELRRNDAQHTPDVNVRTWQQQATDIGVDCGPVDGFFGPRTESAVRTLQQRAGLQNTGVIDEQTWALPWTTQA